MIKEVTNNINIKEKYKTPMMNQYAEIKEEYPDCLLFFRLGDFYELFLEDAKIGSKILDITLTSRNKGQDGNIPMCGVPFHAVDSYLNKLIKAGYKAAICEQVSKPTKGTEIVERQVVRIVTPGTVLSENVLDNKTNNYLLTVNFSDKEIYFAYVDISTGHLYVEQNTINDNSNIYKEIADHIQRIKPAEIVLNSKLYSNFDLLKNIKQTGEVNIYSHVTKEIQHDEIINNLKIFLKTKHLKIFDIKEDEKELLKNTEFLISYLIYTQKTSIGHINKIIRADKNTYLKLDAEAIRNLEIFTASSTMSTNSKSNLFETIDFTKTYMGARKLKQWLANPSVDKKLINQRYNVVEILIKNNKTRDFFSENLNKILDIERLLAKIGTNTANPRDIIALKTSLKYGINILETMQSGEPNILNNINIQTEQLKNILDSTKQIINKIENTIIDEPPLNPKEGGYIKSGINKELDEIIDSISDAREWIAKLENEERLSTGINNLKVSYNSVFGYYIEVSKSNTNKVPLNYVRKQTLVNAERYITEELKQKEQIVLTAEEKTNEIEYQVFLELLKTISSCSKDIQEISEIISTIDLLNSFAISALNYSYVKPVITDMSDFDTEIKEGRHPVVEKVVDRNNFTPNDTNLHKDRFLHLITGPNMSGKSTYIRQVAHIQILAQIGSFVPADSAKISIVDGIYTRIGAGDALAEGLSTFMVEMIETAKILKNATKNSLIILDEVGRGTSTVDGLCIARAVLEHIHNNMKCKTLFATHFHELISLDQRLKYMRNYHVRISEVNGEIKFLHKLEKGGTDKSYGIEVAKLAGLPSEVTNRAEQLINKVLTDQLKFDI